MVFFPLSIHDMLSTLFNQFNTGEKLSCAVIITCLQRDVQSAQVSEHLLIATQPRTGKNTRRFTKREKLLVGVIVFLVSLFVLMAMVFGFLYAKKACSNSQIKEKNTASYPCVTRDCVFTSSGNFAKFSS